MTDESSESTSWRKPTGLKRIWLALFYSLAGFRSAWKSEAAFRQELVLAAIMLPFSIWLGRNALEVIVLVGSVLLVLIVELLNSAIESTVDRIGLEKHPLSKSAKDMGSAAVLLSLLFVVFAGGSIAFDRFLLGAPSN